MRGRPGCCSPLLRLIRVGALALLVLAGSAGAFSLGPVAGGGGFARTSAALAPRRVKLAVSGRRGGWTMKESHNGPRGNDQGKDQDGNLDRRKPDDSPLEGAPGSVSPSQLDYLLLR